MDEKKINFELTPKQIKYKDILNKKFLELEMWAISNIDPNRNMTHFTLQAMQNELPNIKNIPILGYFNKGDFEQHNGAVSYDPELKKEYWDINSGERILGLVRETDPVEIVEDKDGLYWIKLRCALWVQYCYKQVKRLLKDKNKKISVEITVHRSIIRDDGVEEILDFTLNGITILGSKNGKEVVEGIPGAHLSIEEKLDSELFAEQKKVLCFAYEGIDAGLNTENTNKEVKSEMEENQMNVTEDTGVSETEGCAEQVTEILDDAKTEQYNAQESEAQVVPEPVESNVEPSEGNSCDSITTYSEGSDSVNGESCAVADEDGNMCTNACDGEPAPVEPEGVATVVMAEQPAEESVITEITETVDPKDEEIESLKAEIAALNVTNAELQAMCDKYCGEIEGYKAEMAEKQTYCDEMNAKFEAMSDYNDIKSRMEVAEAKVWKHFCDSLEMSAREMMRDESIKEEEFNKIIANCQEGKYADEDAIKHDVAYAAYISRPAQTKRYSAPIINTPVVEKQENKTKPGATAAERISAMCDGVKLK